MLLVFQSGSCIGAWSYELAANWRYYAGSLSTEGRDYEAVGVKGIDYVKRPGFAIDNIYKKDSYGNIIGLKFDLIFGMMFRRLMILPIHTSFHQTGYVRRDWRSRQCKK